MAAGGRAGSFQKAQLVVGLVIDDLEGGSPGEPGAFLGVTRTSNRKTCLSSTLDTFNMEILKSSSSSSVLSLLPAVLVSGSESVRGSEMVVVSEAEHEEPAINPLCFLGHLFLWCLRSCAWSSFFFLKQIAQGVSTICILDKNSYRLSMKLWYLKKIS